MKQFDALFRIYKRGEMNTRPLEHHVTIQATSKDDAYSRALALAESRSMGHTDDVVVITRRNVRLIQDTVPTAILVTFTPRTRIVVDIPRGQSLDEFLESDRNFGRVAALARRRMLEEPANYLCADNVSDVDPDTEMPYDPVSDGGDASVPNDCPDISLTS